MPSIPDRTQQQRPIQARVEIPADFPEVPQEIQDRFPSAEDWQRRISDFWTRTSQAIQDFQVQVANQVNSQTVFSVDTFNIYGLNRLAQPIFSLDGTGVRLGNVLVVSTAQRTVHIGVGQYQNDNTPFYVDVDGKFSLGSKLTWDPVSATLTITGTIIATSGTIGGFDIGADYIRDAANSFGLASTVTGGDDVRFWAGATFANRGSAPFSITESGVIKTTGLGFGAAPSPGVTLHLRNTMPASAGFAGGIASGTTLTATFNGDLLEQISVEGSLVKGAFTGLTSIGLGILNPGASGAGTIDNQYQVYIYAPTRGTTNYSIYSAGGNNVLLGGLNSTPIGATTPSTGAFTTVTVTTLETINGNGGALTAPPSTTYLHIAGADGAIVRQTIDSFAASGQLYFRRADTSNAAKSAVQNNEQICAVVGAGYGASAYGGATAYMAYSATENWSNTAQGTKIDFAVTPNGSVTVAVGMTLASTGLTVVGSIATSAPTGGAGLWKLGKYTAGVLAQAGSVLVNVDGVDYKFLTA